MILLIIIGFILLVLITRIIEFILFMKKVTIVCHKYDRKFINKNPMYLLDMIKDRNNYHTTSEWSAYNFLFFKGPSPQKIFLSFKKLTLENIYSEGNIKKLKEYEII